MSKLYPWVANWLSNDCYCYKFSLIGSHWGNIPIEYLILTIQTYLVNLISVDNDIDVIWVPCPIMLASFDTNDQMNYIESLQKERNKLIVLFFISSVCKLIENDLVTFCIMFALFLLPYPQTDLYKADWNVK